MGDDDLLEDGEGRTAIAPLGTPAATQSLQATRMSATHQSLGGTQSLGATQKSLGATKSLQGTQNLGATGTLGGQFKAGLLAGNEIDFIPAGRNQELHGETNLPVGLDYGNTACKVAEATPAVAMPVSVCSGRSHPIRVRVQPVQLSRWPP